MFRRQRAGLAVFQLLVLLVSGAGCAVKEPLDPEPAVDTGALTGFTLTLKRVNTPDLMFHHPDRPEVARRIANMVAERASLLDDPPRLGDHRGTEYSLVLHYRPGEALLELFENSDLLDPAAGDYMLDGDRWYSLEPDTIRIIHEIAQIPGVCVVPDQEHGELLAAYGWTASYRLNSYSSPLPDDFVYRGGDFPIALFWAHRSEVSNMIGLDLRAHLGEDVVITIYRLDRDIPELAPSGRGIPRAVLVEASGRIIGAWLDKGHGDAMALTGEMIPPNEELLCQFVDTQSPLELELRDLGPEAIIRAYWEAVDAGDHHRAHACETRELLFQRLFSFGIWDYTRHATESYPAVFDNFESAEVLSIEPFWRPPEDPQMERDYAVRVHHTFKEPCMFFGDGPVTASWVVTVRNTPTGWRIRTRGTGG